jgi:hypothetical protein
MDPNEALKDARAALVALNTARNAGDVSGFEEAAIELADAFEALDGWIAKGGFLPTAWDRRP